MDTTAEVEASTRLTIDVWADVLCPWCYLGEARLSTAIAQTAHAGSIDLVVHSYQLDPAASTDVVPLLGYLAAKFGVSQARAREMEERVAGLAAAEGLPYVIDRFVSSTFDQLRLVHLGAEHGVGWEYLRAMQTAVFSGDADAFAPDTLVGAGVALGIPEEGIREVLATDRHADAVRADHDEAIALGARGVPFTVLGRRFGIPGAVGVDDYRDAIEQAWEHVRG